MKKIVISLLALLFSLTTLYAKGEKLPLLFVETEGCHWCEKMRSEVFEDPKMFDQLKTMYKIKKIKKGTTALPKFIHPQYYPTTFVLSKDGQKVIEEIPGYMKPQKYLNYLKVAYEIENEEDEK